ncbi:MAG: phosphate regulon sensor histidine kinase PhoR [Betaproteobacteria bacterium]|nr:phosphate regulon sensor histidine kinase PhoR [Betaproteobacteria bacterium]
MTPLEIILGLVAAALGWLAWRDWREFRKLRRWAAQPRLTDPPEADGEWGEVFNDLHRHRRATLHRRQQLAQLIVRSRRGAEALPYGVAVLDRKYRLDWCNEAARAHLGLDPERDRGQAIGNFVREPEFVSYLHAGDFSLPVRLESTGTRRRTLSLQIVSFGQEEHLLLSQDVTGAARLEEMRRDFVSNVSHELRTPLTVLAGFLETIQDLKLDAGRVHDYVSLMAPQAERMKRLIEDLLTLSSLEHAPAPPPANRIAVRLLLERVRHEAEAISRGHHRISVAIEGEHDLAGAEGEIASVFLNLVTNAVRYTPDGGEVRLRWRSGEDGAEFSVEDTGIGIEPEHLPRLTERFYRVDRSRSRETGGTGLGLSIVKHALARHNGVLSVDSVPGKGSRFSARFPATRVLATAPQVSKPVTG